MSVLTPDERAVSSTLSTVLIVGLVVIAGSVLSVYAVGLANESLSEAAPRGTFDWSYNTSTGNLEVTYDGGETIDPGNLAVTGPGVEGDKFTRDKFGKNLTAGDTVVIPFAQLGDTYKIVWSTPETSAVIAEFSPPAGVDYLFDYSPEPSENGVEIFKQKMNVINETDIYYQNSGGVTIRENDNGNISEGKFAVVLDSPRRNITVDVDIAGQVSSGTGVEMYAVTENGSEIVVFCKPGKWDNSSGYDFHCDGGRLNGVDKTISIRDEAPITKLVLRYKTDNGWEPVYIDLIKIAR